MLISRLGIVKKLFALSLIAGAALSLSVVPAESAEAATTTKTASADSCGFHLWSQSYTNCDSWPETVLVTYVGGNPQMGFQYYTKEFCIIGHQTQSVQIPGGFWIAEGIIKSWDGCGH